MRLRRRLLSLLSLVSLALLLYAGVSFAFSVPVDLEDAEANASPMGELSAGSRAVVVPVADAGGVSTFRSGGEATFGYPGAMLAYGRPDGFWPAAADEVSFGRALMYLPADAQPPTDVNRTDVGTDTNRTSSNATTPDPQPWLVNLTGVPLPHANGTQSVGNLTVNLSALYDGREGFVVKADHHEEPTFVPLEDVVGQVARLDPAARLVALVGGAAVGFLVPMGMLVATRREAEEDAARDRCRECDAPLVGDDAFCTACGAWTTKDKEDA